MTSLAEFQNKPRPVSQKRPPIADAVQLFVDRMAEHGLMPDEVVADGDIHRFKVGSGNNQDGYYSLSLNEFGGSGIFGDWSIDAEAHKWSTYNENNLSSDEMARLRRMRARQADALLAESIARKESGAERARAHLESYNHANESFAYIQSKQIGVFDDIKYNQWEGLLVVPVYGPDGEPQTYQRIWPDGTKRFMGGGSSKGGFYPILGESSVVCVCEGYATGWTINQATGYLVLCAFNAGGLATVAEMAKEKYPSAEIKICADNDHTKEKNVGLMMGTKAAKLVGGSVVYPDSLDGVSDFNDLATVSGMEAVAICISGGNKTTARVKFGFVQIGDVLSDIKPTKWLIKGILEDEVLAVLFGQPGSYKSFVALSWACCVATGTKWYGNDVVQGPVFYIVGEGANGIRKRCAAWSIGNGVSLKDAPLYISTTPTQLLDDKAAADVSRCVDELTAMHGRPAAVVIDTLARNFGPGDENSTADMSRFVSNVDKYIGNNCLRLIVHHTGHGNQDRARGNSSLLAAIDAEYRLVKNEDKTAALTSTKMKDEPEWSEEMLLSPKVAVVCDKYAEDIKSIYLVHEGNQSKTDVKKQAKDKKEKKQLSEEQEEIYLICKRLAYENDGLKSPPGTVLKCDLVDVVTSAGIYKNSYTTKRAIERMVSRELLRINGELVTPC